MKKNNKKNGIKNEHCITEETTLCGKSCSPCVGGGQENCVVF